MALPQHLFIGVDGGLHDTRQPKWAEKPIRRLYSRTCANIRTTTELKATLRAGPCLWPGGYPMFFFTSDGGALSFDSVRENLRSVLDSIRSKCDDGWRVVGCEVNWEDDCLIDDHSGKSIKSAYGPGEVFNGGLPPGVFHA